MDSEALACVREMANQESPARNESMLVRADGDALRAVLAEYDRLAAVSACRDKLLDDLRADLDTMDRHLGEALDEIAKLHGAAGCRIGDRMDWLMADFDLLRIALDKFVHDLRDKPA